MLKNKIVIFFTLLIIIAFTFFIRCYKLGLIPPGLNRDEVSIGYTAYSLMKTGKDEYGISWPISIKSFGDWKLPLYPYIDIPFVGLLGLTENAVRYPAVIVGSMIVLAIYFIAYEIFRRNDTALVAAILTAINPWQIFFSRVASEANLAILGILFAYYFFLRSKVNSWFFIVTAILSGLTLYTYHGNHIFTPLWVLLLIFVYRKKLIGKFQIISLGVFVLLISVIYYQTLFSADKTKISGLLSLNDPSIVHENIVKNRLIVADLLIGKIYYNKGLFAVEEFIKKYLNTFSPDFLFIQGGANSQHNIPDFGNLYILDVPFILIGIYFLLKNKNPHTLFIIGWLLLAPIPAALTKDAPHSARSLVILPPILLITAYGLCEILNKFKLKWRVGVSIGITSLYGFIFSIFLIRYFTIFPYKSDVNWGRIYKEMVSKIVKYESDYNSIVIARPDYSPYIYYLFYTRANPEDVQKNMQHYLPTGEGFEHVKSYAGIDYRKIDWPVDLHAPNSLYIDWADSVPASATSTAVLLNSEEKLKYDVTLLPVASTDKESFIISRLLDEVDLVDGTPYLYLIETRLAKLQVK